MAKDTVDRPVAGTVAPRSRNGWHGPVGPWLIGGLAAATALFTPVGAAAKTALLVVGSTTLSASDAALKGRLDHYYTTTVRDDGAAADTSRNLIVISATANVGSKYKSAPMGVLVLAPGMFPAMGMTANSAFGTLSGQTRIKVVDASHQMAAGFAANALVPVYGSGQRVGWGTPAATALKVALAADGVGGHAAIFRYASGATLADGSIAPARRAGYYVAAANALTAAGWKLFDHAADYVDGSAPPVSGGSSSAITWASSITRLAKGCGDWTPTWAPDDRLYTMWGDCNGITGKLTVKQSMGLSAIAGLPPTPTLAEITTGSIDSEPGGLVDFGNGPTGAKPSGMVSVGSALYALVRNIQSDGTRSRLRYTPNYAQPNGTWRWADWTFAEFGYPVFVQYGKAFAGAGDYAYVVAHDNPSSYRAGDRFILMRVPKGRIIDQSAWEFFSGTTSAPSWVSYADRAQRTGIFTSKGRCLRSGMTYNAARGRYYWWQEIPPTWDDPDARFFGGFAIYSAPQPWGRWTPVYYTEKWDVGPGEKGELPTKWMSASGIGASGDMHLVFSGDDYLAIRKGTIAAGF